MQPLTTPPSWLEPEFCGEPVHGWKAITVQGEYLGTAGEGGSPTYRSIIDHYVVVTDCGYYRVDPNGTCMSAGMLNPAPAGG